MTMKASSSSAAASSAKQTAAHIKILLKEIEDDRADAARLDELRRLFARLHEKERHQHDEFSTVKRQWKIFLNASHERMVSQLCRRIAEGKRTAVRTLWGVLATCPATSARQQDMYTPISSDLLRKWIGAVCQMPHQAWSDKSVQHMVGAEVLEPYRDVQYYTMRAIDTMATALYNSNTDNGNNNGGDDVDGKDKGDNDNEAQVAERLLQLLMLIPIPKSQGDLDEESSNNNNGYLFPPVTNALPPGVSQEDGEDNESVDEDESDEDDDGSITSYDSASEEGDEHEMPLQLLPVAKKRKKKEQAEKSKKQRALLFNFQQVQAHHRAWSRAWLAVLRLPSLSTSALKKALHFLPTNVLPVVARPLRFSDFYMSAYNHVQQGVVLVPILALEGLFVLMTQHGLEYPDFYKQLYALVRKPSLFYVKYRVPFFRLLDKCLSRNQMLPAAVVSAFAKRLLRGCLTAPPSGILFCLALTSNLLRKHPEMACLVHRNGSVKNSGYVNDTSITATTAITATSRTIEDGFDAETDDPEKANALQSSLWELKALERHYLPAVVTMARSVGREEELKAPLHDLQHEFCAHTYQSLFEQERKRKRQRTSATKTTPLTFVRPPSLFTRDDMFSGILYTAGTVD